MSTETVLEEVRAERENQKGIYTPEHDDTRAPGEWYGLLQQYIVRGLSEMVRGGGLRAARFHLLVVAAIAVAGIEAIDRKGASG